MKLIHFLRLTESSLTEAHLAEAANYLPMVQGVINFISDPIKRNEVQQEAIRIEKEVRKILKKNDRCTWFFRWYKIALQKYLQNDQYDLEFLVNTLPTFEHYLSLPIVAITDFQFTNQKPEDIIAYFEECENEWQSKQSKLLNSDNEEVLLRFPNGWAWFNLRRPYCSKEARAMGHCGNKPRQYSNDTILSLREPVGNLWYPVATFILTYEGYLTEMKGRANDKPIAKYHPYIMALLKHHMIKGIIGGGYMAQNNFSLKDLTPEQKEEIYSSRKDLIDNTVKYYMDKVSENGMALQHVPEEFKTEELCLIAVSGYGLALRYVPNKLKTKEMCWRAVNENGVSLRYVPKKIRTKEMCWRAVSNNGLAFEYVPDELKTEEMIRYVRKRISILTNGSPFN